MRGWRPIAKVASDSNGKPEILWNPAELTASGMHKAAVVAYLARLLPQGSAEPEWSR